jgi:uncharacterized membrane protein YiaA
VTLHVSVINLAIFRGCSLYNAAFRLVASSQFYLGMWPYLLSVLSSCVPLCCRGYVAVSSICVVVMCTSLLSWVCGRIFYLCCCHVYLSAFVGMWPYLLSVLLSCVPLCCRSFDSREVHMTTQIEETATYPSKIVTKQQGGKQHCARNIPWRWPSLWPEQTQQTQTF